MKDKHFGVLFIYYLTLLIICHLILQGGCSEGNDGIMQLCPSGGESFNTAWQLACGIKKKRSLPIRVGKQRLKRELLYRPLTMTEMMDYCCKFGCTIRDLLPYCDPFGGWNA
ncbi:unnamed protein product [Thelazia callipaeda]|uniref:IlGF domain-containing protein n=1 Tax=Thelazia callipaeda TaxID=103827 RepID=A0A0N5CPP3_THECL|nr:unnamed protein product [Thelazia callipaeda]